MKVEDFLSNHNKRLNGKQITKGDFNTLDTGLLSFPGIYIICDQDCNVKYIGSSYAFERTIGIRLRQYLSKSKTGNTLGNALVREGYCKNLDEAVKIILDYKFIAFESKDLEYELISETPDLINYAGKRKN